MLQRLCSSLVAQQSSCRCRCASATAVAAPRLTARQRAMAQAGRAGCLPATQRCAPRALKFLQSRRPAGTLRRPLMARRSASEQNSSAAHRPVEAVQASPLPPVRLQGIVGRSQSYPSAAEVQYEYEARRWPHSPCCQLYSQVNSSQVSQSVSYFTVPPRAHPSTGSQSGSATPGRTQVPSTRSRGLLKSSQIKSNQVQVQVQVQVLTALTELEPLTSHALRYIYWRCKPKALRATSYTRRTRGTLQSVHVVM